MGDELSARRAVAGRRDRDLAAELVGLVRFPFADALDLGRVQRVDLGVRVAALLGQHSLGQPQRPAEDVL